MSELIKGAEIQPLLPDAWIKTARSSGCNEYDELVRDIFDWKGGSILSVLADALHWADELKHQRDSRCVIETIGKTLLDGQISPHDVATLLFLSTANAFRKKLSAQIIGQA
ncbi:MAG: hypothetical protein NTV33_10985 [Coprothermobacterota bacterium]|nr:hypothetical protein [Coprothermobacterota bacterium]